LQTNAGKLPVNTKIPFNHVPIVAWH
jgi:hypothetical protein